MPRARARPDFFAAPCQLVGLVPRHVLGNIANLVRGSAPLPGAVGGLAGNMTLERQAEERRQQGAADHRTQQQLQLDFERQRAVQAEQTRVQIEEQRLFEQWRREQGV